MARKFSELLARMDPKAVAEAKAWADAQLSKMPLFRIRSARKMTQEQLATILNVDQSSVSKLEQRTDPRLSTLSSYVEAMGGKLDIRAVFPDGEVRIDMKGKSA
jgi:DNA-binding XRE family transcriptional regulator